MKVDEKILQARLKFNLTEKDTETIFGSNWKLCLCKPDNEILLEVDRIADKIVNSMDYRRQITHLIDNIFQIISYFVKVKGNQENWDPLTWEDAEEGLDEL